MRYGVWGMGYRTPHPIPQTPHPKPINLKTKKYGNITISTARQSDYA